MSLIPTAKSSSLDQRRDAGQAALGIIGTLVLTARRAHRNQPSPYGAIRCSP